MSYSAPIYESYTVLANASLSTAALAKRFIGPEGLTGRIVNCSAVITTATTDAASTIQVGIESDPNSAFSMSVPITAVNLGHVATAAELSAAGNLTADTIYQIYGGGEATAGAADITLTVAWF